MKEKLEAILAHIEETESYSESDFQEIRGLFASMAEQLEEFKESARQAEKIADHWQEQGKMLQAKLGEGS